VVETPSVSYHNIIQASSEPGCPLCRLAEKSIAAYLGALMYELVNDPEARGQIRETLGFCNVHAHHLLAMTGSALGTGIIYRDVVNTVLKQLEAARYASPPRMFLHRLPEALDPQRPALASEAAVRALSPRSPCPVCVQQEEMEALAVAALMAGLGDEELRAALRGSAGLCLPHLRRALQAVRSRTAFDILVGIARDRYAALRAELDEFIRKNDYRFQHEGMGAEGDSWRRAVDLMTGRPGGH
jgi:hypothetical protein